MYLQTPALMPRTSRDAPTPGEVRRIVAKVNNLEIAAFRARQAVGCASHPRSMPSANLEVDAAIAQRQLAATLPRTISSFVSRDDNLGLPHDGGQAKVIDVIALDGSGRAVGLPPKVWPQSIGAVSALIQDMQVSTRCAVAGTGARRRLPCGVAPAWGLDPGDPSGGTVGGLSASAVLSWMRSNPWLLLGIAGAGVLALSQRKGRG